MSSPSRPHLDDVGLSASARLRGAGATVVTVFAGYPPPDAGLSLWDRVTGAASARQRIAAYRKQDPALGLDAASLARDPDKIGL